MKLPLFAFKLSNKNNNIFKTSPMWQTSGANLVAATIRNGQTPMEGVTYMNQQSLIVQGPTPMVGVTYMNQQPQSQVSLVNQQQSPFDMVYRQ